MKFDSKTFNPQAFGKYVERIPQLKKNELVKSGALKGNTEIRNAFSSQTGTAYAILPMYGLLDGEVLNYDGQNDITATTTTTYERGVVVTGRAKAWTEGDFAVDITGGVDFMDNVAQQVAGELAVDRVYSELLPADKVSKVEELLAKKTEKEKLAFVGDGINDAPVLSRADIGIAMGAMGSDAAIEAADVVLMDDDPMKIVKAIRIAKKCMRIVYENIYFAIGIKVICLILGAVGIANMWVAIFADVGVMIIAVLNAIRTLFVKKL